MFVSVSLCECVRAGALCLHKKKQFGSLLSTQQYLIVSVLATHPIGDGFRGHRLPTYLPTRMGYFIRGKNPATELRYSKDNPTNETNPETSHNAINKQQWNRGEVAHNKIKKHYKPTHAVVISSSLVALIYCLPPGNVTRQRKAVVLRTRYASSHTHMVVSHAHSSTNFNTDSAPGVRNRRGIAKKRRLLVHNFGWYVQHSAVVLNAT